MSTKQPVWELIRRVRFTPYTKGAGPTFALTMWDTNRRDSLGKWLLGYQLTMTSPDQRCPHRTPIRTVLFQGEDFGCSPCHATDSNDSVVGLMHFLTLRPGDTDREYFADYTAEQLDYCAQHAEALGAEVQARFCDESGRVIER